MPRRPAYLRQALRSGLYSSFLELKSMPLRVPMLFTEIFGSIIGIPHCLMYCFEKAACEAVLLNPERRTGIAAEDQIQIILRQVLGGLQPAPTVATPPKNNRPDEPASLERGHPSA